MTETLTARHWSYILLSIPLLWIGTSFAGSSESTNGERHWAFRPPEAPPLPEVRDPSRVLSHIDAFAQSRLEELGLDLGDEADRGTLIRRVAFDLTGLPPTPGEIDIFLADSSPAAYERMVDRYLASPRYGERQATHWLDAVGYADSNGRFHADSDRPLAYRYRDYVIRAFADDKPYDRFVREQVAGDEIVGYEAGGDVTPDIVDALTATHFLRNAQDGTGESDGPPEIQRIDRYSVLEGNLQILMSSLLGITIQCARCHDHKFEPITQREYFSLQAIFFGAYNPERWTKPNDRFVTMGTKSEREAHRRLVESLDGRLSEAERKLERAAAPRRRQVIEERLEDMPEKVRAAILAAYLAPAKKRSDAQQELLEKNAKTLEVNDDDLGGRFPDYAEARQTFRAAEKEIRGERPPPLDKIAVLVDIDREPPDHHVLVRGNYEDPGDAVVPGVPAVLSRDGDSYALDGPPSMSTGRRLALARWLTSPRNPLLARVLVNRVWQFCFTNGIVRTSENFGVSGEPPTHPELLDHLATELVTGGWSIKSLHRRILGSRVYRQRSAFRSEAHAVDPENRFLWRYPVERLEAEAIRDAVLAASGRIDLRIGGPYVPTEHDEEGVVIVDPSRDDARRRSIYLQQRRTRVLSLLEVFDKPGVSVHCTQRSTSAVPLQSLSLLNSGFVRRQARAMAERLERECGADNATRIRRAFRLAFGRLPSDEEQSAVVRFLKTQRRVYADDAKSSSSDPESADIETSTWTDFVQMLFASNEFIYVE